VKKKFTLYLFFAISNILHSVAVPNDGFMRQLKEYEHELGLTLARIKK
jgi:hypothetical protein